MITEQKTISECEICSDIVDRGFEATRPDKLNEVASKFLEHVLVNHTGELMDLLAQKYIPVFMSKRALR